MRMFTNLEYTAEQRDRMLRIVGGEALHFGHAEKPQDGDEQAFTEAEVVFGWCPAEWLPRARRLRWMQFDSVGFDRYLALDWRQLAARITCTNLQGFFARPVAETVLAGVLSLYRGVDQFIALKAQCLWNKLEVRPQLRMLSDAQVLLVGYGSINRRLHDLIRPFGCRVTAYDTAALPPAVRTITELEKALRTADIVSGALPETEQTRRLFDHDRLGLMKSSAVFVNVGRGSLVDEVALMAALKSGRLGGAVLDVTQREPLPPESPLWRCPRLILTQHTAGGSVDEVDRKIAFFEKNLARFRRGEPLECVVDWERGY